MFYVSYMLSELRRRRGRTVLTALGLAVGVGLVVVVNALSTGLDRAQDKVLKPLTGVGTDLSVSRPIDLSKGFQGLSANERAQLQKENGPRRIGLRSLGQPGTHFSRDDFVAAGQLSFSASEVNEIGKLAGVQEAAGSLTLSAIHVEGTVPKQTQQPRFGAGPATAGPPDNVDVNSLSVTGVDETHPALAAVTPSQLTTGRYFTRGSRREAILNVSYARRKGIAVGGTVKLAGANYTVIGLAKTPLGGQASDIYVKLAQLQKVSGRVGRVNTVLVRATSSEKVGALARHIRQTFDGASVTTAKDLADRVSGSLVDAKSLSSKLGTALEILGLLAAFLIASLLTLSSVTKRVRELGTLKALGWPQRLVVRQVTGESLLQGLLGGAVGVALGIGGSALIGAIGPTLKATVAQTAAPQAGFLGPFGQGAVSSGSTAISLDAPVSLGLIALAVVLAVAGGLVSGAVGGLRASGLRPADALRHLD